MKNLAVIPARGGSKRIPKKNTVDFFGKPMIAWTIEAALESGCFDSVLVSTDCQEIREISLRFGAQVPFLRSCFADDLSPVSMATLEAARAYSSHVGVEPEVVVQLMANCPLRRASDIRGAVAAFHRHGAAIQVSACRYGWLNPWWAHEMSASGEVRPLFRFDPGRRSQDLPTLLCPTGAIWMARFQGLLEAGTFYGPGYRLEEIGQIAAIDIDEEEDMEMAKLAFLRRHAKEGE